MDFLGHIEAYRVFKISLPYARAMFNRGRPEKIELGRAFFARVIYMPKHKISKLLSTFFLVILVLNLSMVSVYTQGDCQCRGHGKSITTCCNCPGCVEGRGGFLSHCQLKTHTQPNHRDKTPVFRPFMCTCGWETVLLNLPLKTPFLVAQKLQAPAMLPMGSIEVGSKILVLPDFPLSFDPPG